MNPVGTLLPQWFRMRLRSIGRLSLMPRMLALSTVQRHTAASRSTSPSSSGQQGNVGGTPTLALIRPNTLAHTPSFSASRGHLPNAEFLFGTAEQIHDHE